ncbi:MAG: serine hydrolase domain-containing protein [Pirellulales bacterium]
MASRYLRARAIVISARLAFAGLALCSAALTRGAEQPALEAAQQRYAEIVARELERGIVPGVSVAWVVDGRTVHAAGFGLADKERGVAATADTIYRAGSISKLFNAVAAMQLVEQGQLDLDAPIERALPEFHIVVPFADAGPITARQLLCHRSGMIRESPVGGYLDNRQPNVQATIASVADCALVNLPNTKTRYSNVGPTIVGRAVEVQSNNPYPEYQAQRILGPLGMASSAWLMNDALRPRLAKGLMRIAQGDGTYAFDAAPEFELGTIPAGNLYTTAPDLARFAAFVMDPAPQQESSPAIISRESLAKMLEVQLTGEPNGFGLGFGVNRYRGHKTAQHMGAVYGFTTSIVVLPKERIAAIVLSNADIAVAPVRRLSEAALDLLLEATQGEPLPAAPQPSAVSAAALAACAGDYESPGYWASLKVVDGALVGTYSGQPIELMPQGGDKFLASGRMMHHTPFEFTRDNAGQIVGFTAAGQTFRRAAATDAADLPPEHWQKLAGRYGLPFIPLVVSVRHGHLYALAENEYDYRLTPVNRLTFALPQGMYEDEELVFQTAADGNVLGVVMANMYLPRRAD